MPVSIASQVGSAQCATTTPAANTATSSIARLGFTAGDSGSWWAPRPRAQKAAPRPTSTQASTSGISSSSFKTPRSSAITISAEIPSTNSARRASAPVQPGTSSSRT